MVCLLGLWSEGQGERCRNGRIAKLEECQLGFGVTLNRFPFALILCFFPKFPKCFVLGCHYVFQSFTAHCFAACAPCLQMVDTFVAKLLKLFKVQHQSVSGLETTMKQQKIFSIFRMKHLHSNSYGFHDFRHGLSPKSPEMVWKTSRWGRRCCATATCWKSCTLSSPPKWETLTWCGREGNQGRYRLNPFRKGSLGAIPKFLSNCLSATENVTLVSNNHWRFVNCDFGDITDMIQVPVLYFNDYGRKRKE